jgi:hypothetical protein
MTVAITSAGTEGRPRPVKEVLEHRVGEDRRSVLGQKGVHRAFFHEVTAEGGGIEKLAVRPAGALHLPILLGSERTREPGRQFSI